MHDYECSVCKTPVIVLPNGTILRGCKHTKSAVVANMKASTTLIAGAAQKAK